jgi:hypothetical protein
MPLHQALHGMAGKEVLTVEAVRAVANDGISSGRQLGVGANPSVGLTSCTSTPRTLVKAC